MAPDAAVLLVTGRGDAAEVLADAGAVNPRIVPPEIAMAVANDCRARRLPVVVVLDASTVHLPSVLTEFAIKFPEVPLVVATERGAQAPVAPTRAAWRPARSAALTMAIDGAARTAAQQARVRTTLDQLNLRLRSVEVAADDKQHQRLLLSGLYLSNIVEQARDAIFVTDRTGAVALWNRAAEALFGVPAAAIVGRRIDAVGDAGSGAALLPLIQRLSPAAPSAVAEFSAPAPGGARDLEVSLSLVLDHEGTGIAVSGVMRDMTERNALYAQLRQTTEALAASNRHKEEFLAVMSHELRTPLNTVLGWARMLQEMPHDVQHVQRAAEMIVRNATVQWRLVSDLLEYARITAGQMTLQRRTSDLASLAWTVVEGVRPEAQVRGIHLLQHFEEGVTVAVDRERMTQVLANLLTNALKFTPEGGEVHVSVRRSAGQAELEVRDTGRGIDPGFVPHVFDPFRQGDPSTTRRDSGMGLGLSITQRIVQMHNGVVEARSEGLDRGATFTVRLPLAEAPVEEHA